jgi:hypothetical protein
MLLEQEAVVAEVKPAIQHTEVDQAGAAEARQ